MIARMVALMRMIMNDWFERSKRLFLFIFLCIRSGGCYLFLILLLSMIQARLSIILSADCGYRWNCILLRGPVDISSG